MEYTTAVFAMQPNRTTFLQAAKPETDYMIFDVQDHLDTRMLANMIKRDLKNFDSNAKPLAEESEKVQIQRSKCKQAAAWPCMANKNIRSMPDQLIPSQKQTMAVLLRRVSQET